MLSEILIMEPNLIYIEKISENDLEFKSKIISIIKNEFPLEKKEFYDNIKSKKYIDAAQNVHKIKHKINMFGLIEGANIAIKFENELNQKKIDSYNDFIVVLNVIDNFLNKI